MQRSFVVVSTSMGSFNEIDPLPWMTILPLNDVLPPDRAYSRDNQRHNLEKSQIEELIKVCSSKRIVEVTIQPRSNQESQWIAVTFRLGTESQMQVEDEKAAEQLLNDVLASTCNEKFAVVSRRGFVRKIVYSGMD